VAVGKKGITEKVKRKEEGRQKKRIKKQVKGRKGNENYKWQKAKKRREGEGKEVRKE
jgi:hypothetical protein